MKKLVFFIWCMFTALAFALENEFFMETKARTWSYSNGKKVTACWAWISKDATNIWFAFNGQEVPFQVSVSSLMEPDKQYIAARIAADKAKGLVWEDGVYLADNLLRAHRYNKTAKKIVLAQSTKLPIDFVVFQSFDDTALCAISQKSQRSLASQSVGYADSDSFLWVHGKHGTVVNQKEYTRKRLYWCGTYTYESKGGSTRTVPKLASTMNMAIKIVRQMKNLYDGDDPDIKYFNPGLAARQKEPKSPHEGSAAFPIGDHPAGYGSGFFITDDGYLLTNAHVADGGKIHKVVFNKKEYQAQVISKDDSTDLALLKIDAETIPLPFSLQRRSKLGSEVFATGFPQPTEQGYEPKVTKGVISGDNGLHDSPTQYQIDASIQPGNSGGPVCDSRGNLVGVAVASLNDLYFLVNKGSVPQNVNYAIKKSYVLAFLDNNASCVDRIVESDSGPSTFEEAVAKVCKSTVLIKVYR